MTYAIAVTNKQIVNIQLCGCWILWLAQGAAVLLCATHQDTILEQITTNETRP